MKNYFIYSLLIIFLSSCSEENNFDNVKNIPQEISFSEFTNLKILTDYQGNQNFKRMEFLNEKEAFIQDYKNNIHYYVINEEKQVLLRIEAPSNKRVNFKEIKFDQKIRLCEITTSDGCSSYVNNNFLWAELTITCGSQSSTSYWPATFTTVLCGAGYLQQLVENIAE